MVLLDASCVSGSDWIIIAIAAIHFCSRSIRDNIGFCSLIANQKDHLLSVTDPIPSGEITIPRIYAEVDDHTLAQLEEIAEKRGCSKRQLVLDAIGLFLNYKEPDTSEVDRLKAQLDQAISERDLARSECDKRSSEIKSLDLEVARRNDDLSNARSSIDKLTIGQNQLKSDIASIKGDKEKLEGELEHSQSIIEQKNEEIAFLRGHIKQLSEKIISALPSKDDKAKAKKWWQFW
ncbi:MAG: hypothetical protein ACE14P_14420 [Methanotrichaceae archaeon]